MKGEQESSKPEKASWSRVAAPLEATEKRNHAKVRQAYKDLIFANRHKYIFKIFAYYLYWSIIILRHNCWVDAFELWCQRRLLRVPWTERTSNQSILKEISLGCSLEGLLLKLKLQYFGHLMGRMTHWKRPWCWERLKVGGEEDDRGWDGWMESPMQWTWVWVSSRSWWWTGRPGVLQSMRSQESDTTEQLNWTEACVT